MPVIEVRNRRGSADRAAKMVLRKGGSGYAGGVIEKSVGIENLVTEELVEGSVILVAAGLGGKVDDAAGETSELGRQVVGLNFKFLNGILRGSQGQDIEIGVVQRGAVEKRRALIGSAASNLEIAARERILPRGILQRAAADGSLRNNARDQSNQGERIAPVQRQFIDLPG